MLGLGFQISKHGRSLRATLGTALSRFFHVKCCIQFSQTLTLSGKLSFLREWFANLCFCGFLLIVEIRQLFFSIIQLIRDTGKGIVQTDQITSAICTQGDTMAHGTFQHNVELMSKTVEGKGNINDAKYRQALVDTFINKIYLYDDKMTVLYNTQDSHSEVTIDDKSLSRVGLVEMRGIEPLSEGNLTRLSPSAVCYLHSLIPTGTNTLRESVAS